jgi:hypothetical protein
MPKGDRTGPLGQGPGTGRAFGFCHGYDSPGYTKGSWSTMGRGFGYGRRRGIGWGSGPVRGWGFRVTEQNYFPTYPWSQPVNKDDEIKLLKSEADALKRSQKEVEKRLAELEKEE